MSFFTSSGKPVVSHTTPILIQTNFQNLTEDFTSPRKLTSSLASLISLFTLYSLAKNIMALWMGVICSSRTRREHFISFVAFKLPIITRSIAWELIKCWWMIPPWHHQVEFSVPIFLVLWRFFQSSLRAIDYKYMFVTCLSYQTVYLWWSANIFSFILKSPVSFT